MSSEGRVKKIVKVRVPKGSKASAAAGKESSGAGGAVTLGSWRGYDPRDADWVCSHCGGHNWDRIDECGGCKRPVAEQLTDEQLERVKASEAAGKQLYSRLLLGDFTSVEKDEDEGNIAEARAELLRQWSKCPTQIVYRDGEAKYVLVGLDSEEAIDEPGVQQFIYSCRNNTQPFNFPADKQLDDLSKEVLKTKFGQS